MTYIGDMLKVPNFRANLLVLFYRLLVCPKLLLQALQLLVQPSLPIAPNLGARTSLLQLP